MKCILFFLMLGSAIIAQTPKLKTVFELGNKNQTATYEETLLFFQTLATSHKSVTLTSKGNSDQGNPMHLVLFDASEKTTEKQLNKNKQVLLINNLIHPGEPDGNDATQQLLRDLAEKRIKVPENLIIACIPIYSVGGTLNRNAHSRANQNGPEAYGFRGNARNFDLNRDFIKNDTQNSKAFAEIYHWLQPIVFIDNHVSNGADYQYTFTYIQTQHQKLGFEIGNFMNDTMTPELMKQMEADGISTIPYVTVYGTTPEKGFHQMMDLPRYSSGYTSLFGTIGYLPETHMLKSYEERVKVTYAFMQKTIDFTDQHHTTISKLKKELPKHYPVGSSYPIQWTLDSTKVEKINFKGYTASMKPSEVSGKDRLYYDSNQPFEKEVNYYLHYQPKKTVTIPKAYIVPKAWWPIVERLQLNNLQMPPLQKEVTFEVEVYHIVDYTTVSQPYEGHYLHSNTKLKTSLERVTFQKGDFVISTQQPGIKYLLETLEPEAPDSFFNWNFFDSILQQKEGYSAYVFEDIAAELLKTDIDLKQRFENKKANDAEFAQNSKAQLDWVYKNSPFYEKEHNRYPVYRLIK
jgi:hypothetical protein